MKNCGKTFQLQEKTGFTLAEVLITLGIIGVVAAMTIPTLLANMTGNRHRSQFKKTISTLSQAARMSLEQYGFDFAGNTQWFFGGSIEVCAEQHPENIMTICSLLNGTLTGLTFLGINEYDVSRVSLEVIERNEFVDSVIYQLADGTFFGFSPGLTDCTLPVGTPLIKINSTCMVFIDVNGYSLPNKEVTCSQDGVETTTDVTTPCVVDTKDITDIFPVVLHDSTVEPASNAAKYVLNTAK